MATQLTLQNSINFATPILKNQPLLISNMEPALTAANMVLGMMLGPPCRWRFNRATSNFIINQSGGTDYVKVLTDFGFLETMWLVDANGNAIPLQGAIALPKDSSMARPMMVAPEFDDNAGNITFRVDHTPDQQYTLYFDYQKKSPLMLSMGSTWGPVADEFEYIYQWGFLTIMGLLINDSRFPIWEQYFLSRLLGAQDGLTDQERNIFVGNWVALLSTLSRAEGNIKSGIAGRTK